MKLLKSLFLLCSITTVMPAMAENDVYGIVGDYYLRTHDGDTRFYFRLNGGVGQENLESCMQGSAEDMVWDVPLGTAISDHVIDLVKASREGRKQIRVIGKNDVCASGEPQYGDAIFEVMPLWEPIG